MTADFQPVETSINTVLIGPLVRRRLVYPSSALVENFGLVSRNQQIAAAELSLQGVGPTGAQGLVMERFRS
jgi:hypothetical protein